jgi:transcription elongation factor GreA
MASEKIELTEEGIAKLKTEYRHLIDIDRPQVLDDLKTARNQGDLSENADYDAARNRQAEIEGRIKEIEAILASAIVIREKSKNNKSVSLGSKVELKDLSDNSIVSYTIVGTIEANPVNGFISNISPLGKVIMGKHIGDICVVRVAHEYSVEILKIENK